jgi:hypothetical protein
MTQTIAEKVSLYDQDLNLWLERAIAQLKIGDLKSLDIENLIEELEGLAGRDRRELKERLTTLLEHLLKRCYVNMPDCYDGWEETINRTRNAIADIFAQSPSLKNYVNSPELFQKAFADALKVVRKNKGYSRVDFPNVWQFSYDTHSLLNVDFWEITEK